ncbi:MAG: hypothetical protein CM1200mP1_15160 [Candidatus Neomarinimicrobiota bacterium]|nr:MAG: hypothetical protein CM1200mP1_15160 [Candidatus Neomarinimicrobiota bacterium]
MFAAGESINDLPEKWLIPFLFVFMEVIVSLSILQFWMLAGEVFDAGKPNDYLVFWVLVDRWEECWPGKSLKPFVKFLDQKNCYTLQFSLLVCMSLWEYSLKNTESLRIHKKKNQYQNQKKKKQHSNLTPI